MTGQNHKNVKKRAEALLPPRIMRLLKRIGELSNSMGYRAFVVGGMVRDLLLGSKNLDLDIVVEGKAIGLGQALAADLGATLVAHRKFGTCSVVMKDKMKIDLATARKETYERPAALPTVEFSSLKDDLMRRDFTINAMAVSINKANFGQLIDFFSGEADLRHRCIRVMHDGSFIDDPTRIFRAVRFEQRFGFFIDSHTEDLIKHAIEKEMFDKVSPQRIRDEVILILKEDDPIRALKRMAELDELRFLDPGIRFNPGLVRLYGAIDAVCRWYERSRFKKREIDRWLIYFMALFDDLGYNKALKISDRYVFRKGESSRIITYKANADRVIKALSSPGRAAPGGIYRLLEPLAFEVTLLIMAKAKALHDPRQSRLAESRIRDFFEKYNGVKIHIRGDDIKAMGLEPGPGFRKILDRILYERINGKVRTKKDELALARRLVGTCG